MDSLLHLSNVSVEYNLENASIKALDGVSLDIPSKGYTIGLVGESGSGKSTLGLSLLKLIEPPGRISSGVIEYEGNNVLNMSGKQLNRYRWKDVSIVYQSAINIFNPVKRISDHISEVLVEHSDISKEEARKKAISLLTSVGIKKERTDDYPDEFSGGMRQRAALALALALSPKLLIADEITSALDVVTQQYILSLLKSQVNAQGLSLIVITHEISILNGLVENVAVMYRGEIVEIGPAAKVLFNPIHPYTEMLVGTLLTLDSSKVDFVGARMSS